MAADDLETIRDLLLTGGSGFIWAARQIPEDRRYATPPARLGEWSVARHAFHLLRYEESVALPTLRQWLGGPLPDDGPYLREEDDWRRGCDLEDALERFQQLRAEQLARLSELDEAALDESRNTVWTWMAPPDGRLPLRWALSKTIQHTAEHTHNALGIALFWDHYARKEQSLPANDGRSWP